MKKLKIVLIILFLVMLYGGTMATFAVDKREYSVTENRELARKPKLKLKRILNGKYQKKYEKYLSDQFPLRDGWVDLAVHMQVISGKKDINGVYIGKDGYLLEKQEEGDFDKDKVRENIKCLSSFINDAVKAYGKENVSLVMVPSKTTVLTDRLPSFAEDCDMGWVIEELGKSLEDREVMLDLKDELKKHQNEYIYYRTDHHWTTLGAYYAYSAWAGETGKTPKPLDYYKREAVFTDFYGTTYNKVHIKVPADSVEIFHSPGEDNIQVIMDDGEVTSQSLYFKEEAEEGFNRYNVFFSKNTFKIEVYTGKNTGKNLLLIKDSFSNCFVPFLTGDYDRIVMIDYRYAAEPIGNIMEGYGDFTDVLVMFNTEKFMEFNQLWPLKDTHMDEKDMDGAGDNTGDGRGQGGTGKEDGKGQEDGAWGNDEDTSEDGNGGNGEAGENGGSGAEDDSGMEDFNLEI